MLLGFLSHFPSNKIHYHSALLPWSTELIRFDLGSPNGSQLLSWASYRVMETVNVSD